MKEKLEPIAHPFENIKAKLLEESGRLLRDLRTLADEDPAQPGVFTPKPPVNEVKTDDDSSGVATDVADAVPVITNLQQQLDDSKRALEAIENGTYGFCKYCGKSIDPKRLEARPTSSACITCKKTLLGEL
ncbi:TraR/DksA C4-type zinc finger protein [Patescibacteria group bacterium]|nr:TraR/DksA C4-type zinc finger protein [Patescibacteria group bacterium]